MMLDKLEIVMYNNFVSTERKVNFMKPAYTYRSSEKQNITKQGVCLHNRITAFFSII